VTQPSVLYLVTEPWYFANHRLDHARALIADGFEVHVATRSGDRWQEIADSGCHMHNLDLARGSAGIRTWISEFRVSRALVKQVAPTIVHAVALKPVAIALSLVTLRSRPCLILSVNGLGLSAARAGVRLRVIRSVLKLAARLPRVVLLFQTSSDQHAVLGSHPRGFVIPGVGVDTNRFRPGSPPPAPPGIVVYLGRAVRSKGLAEVAAALRELPVEDLELRLYCSRDELSPGALSSAELDEIASAPGVVLCSHTDTPEAVLASAHAAMLASSAGEGVSKFVLEALACGTPVLVSSQSGSAEVIDDGTTGHVFDAGDAGSIHSALKSAVEWSSDDRRRLSAACRRSAEDHYALDVILPRVVELHRALALGASHR